MEHPPSQPQQPPSPVRSTKASRAQLFAALENGQEEFPCAARPMASADDLDDLQLRTCFEILQASGRATDPRTERRETRHAMEGFLDAVFNEWRSAAADDDDVQPQPQPQPQLDFVVRRWVLAGGICAAPGPYPNNLLDLGSQTPIYAVATFHSKPARLETGFTTSADPASADAAADFAYPWDGGGVHWNADNWAEQLLVLVEDACLAKVHRHNKRMAIWHARRHIARWAKGSAGGHHLGSLAFVRAEQLSMLLAGRRAN